MTNIFKAYNELIESNNLDRLQKIFTRYEFFKKTINIPGDIVECGVFKGTGQIYWLKLLRIFDEYSMKKVKLSALSLHEKENALNEVRIFASLQHETIIAYKEAFFDDIS